MYLKIILIYQLYHANHTPTLSIQTLHQAEFKCQHLQHLQQQNHHRYWGPTTSTKLSLSVFRSKFPLRRQWLENTLQLSSGTALGTDLPTVCPKWWKNIVSLKHLKREFKGCLPEMFGDIWYIFLYLVYCIFLGVNVGTCTIHGSYGYCINKIPG